MSLRREFSASMPKTKLPALRKYSVRGELLKKDDYTPWFTTWKSAGKGTAGESSN